MVRTRWTRGCSFVCWALGAALFAACGGGGGGASGDGGSVTFVVPGAPPGATPPPTSPPPTNPPPTSPPPTSPPPTNPPPTNPPPTNPPPTSPPTLPDLLPIPVGPIHAGYGNVFGAAADPASGAVFTLDAVSGVLRVLAAGAELPQEVGISALRAVRALAYDDVGHTLYAVARGGTGQDDVLHLVNPANGTAQPIGTIAGYDAIEGLAFLGSGAGRRLLAVDTRQDVLLEIAMATGLPTTVGSLGAAGGDIRGLCAEQASGLLLGVDAVQGDLVTIDPATGTASKAVTLAVGALACLTEAPGLQGFFGVARRDGGLHGLDLHGSWIRWSQVRGLAFDAAHETLYGLEPAYGLVFRSDAAGLWRQPLGVLAEKGLSGLAYDPGTAMLYALSGRSLALWRVDPADGGGVRVGTLSAAGGPWTDIASLAAAGGQLYAVHRPTSTVLRIAPQTASATVLTVIPGHTGVQSLAYDPSRDRLLAHADTTHALLALAPVQGAAIEVLATTSFSGIGGLAWMPAAWRLVGADLTGDALATLEQRQPPGLGYDAVHALSLDSVTGACTGFDTATARYLLIDLTLGTAAPRVATPGLAIEGMCRDPRTGRTYALDAFGHSLYTVDAQGTFTRIGASGSLGTRDLRALAFDARGDPGVLYSYDNATSRMVVIDPADGTAQPIGPTLPAVGIEAMTWHADSSTLLAIDRPTRALMEITPATGGVTAIAVLPMAGVRGMAAAVGTDEIVVVDADTDRISLIDRYTGSVLQAYTEPPPTRGFEEHAAVLLWPRGDLRAEGLTDVGIEVSAAYEGDAALVFRRGTDVLHRQAFDPEETVSIVPVPKALKARLRVGDVVTWGLEFSGAKPSVTTSLRVVAAPRLNAALAALAARPYLRRQAAHVRGVRAARVFLRAGLASEAFVRAVHAAWLRPENVPAQRTARRAWREIASPDVRSWRPDDLLTWRPKSR